MAKVKRPATVKGLRSAFDKGDSAMIFCAQATMVIADELEKIRKQKTKIKVIVKPQPKGWLRKLLGF